MGSAASASEEDGLEVKMGFRPERVKQADSQGQVSPHEHTGDPAQLARSYSVFIIRHMWIVEPTTW